MTFLLFTQEQIDAITAELTPIEESELSQLYDDMLDGCYDVVEIAGYTYSTSCALRAVDNVAYEQGYANWLDSAAVEVAGDYYSTGLVEQVIDELEDNDDSADNTDDADDKEDAFIT